MLEVLFILVGFFEFLCFGLEATRHWRLCLTLLGAVLVVLLLGVFVHSYELVWVLGFHIVVAGLIVGLHWNKARKKRGAGSGQETAGKSDR